MLQKIYEIKYPRQNMHTYMLECKLSLWDFVKEINFVQTGDLVVVTKQKKVLAFPLEWAWNWSWCCAGLSIAITTRAVAPVAKPTGLYNEGTTKNWNAGSFINHVSRIEIS